MKRIILLVVFACVTVAWQAARADQMPVGIVSWDTLIISGGPDNPGTNQVTVGNFTGAFSLPPGFPLTDELAFLNAAVQVNFSDGTSQSFTFGDLGAGFLQDPLTGTSPSELQFPDTDLLSSIVFSANITPGQYATADGRLVNVFPQTLVGTVHPSFGDALAPGDFTVLTVTVPEPASALLLACGALVLARLRRRH